nr:hypothetical protein HUO10_005155 [Paraburkholderia busanensis]
MTSSSSGQDKARVVTHTDVHVPRESPAAAQQTPYEAMQHSTGILFQNAVSSQQQQNSLEQAAANQGVMQIYSVDTTAAGEGAHVDVTTALYLASPRTRQCVELACAGPSGLRASREPKALALFCHAHAGSGFETVGARELASHAHADGAFTRWSDDDADRQYKALTGAEPPSYS